MRRSFIALLAVSLLGLAAPAASAGDRHVLGWGRLFDNDALGDMKDRWRTGSYAISIVTGPKWDGVLPSRPGELLEFRLRAEAIAPASLATPKAGDRRYAGVFSAGVHTHFSMAGIETSAGLDLVAIGPMTGIGNFHKTAHEVFGLTVPTVLDNQIGNQVQPTLTTEFARSYSFGNNVSLRPFAELSAGVETFARVGGDFLFGPVGQSDLYARDVVTGQRYRTIYNGGTGYSFSLGGDIAKVFSSTYLPENEGYELTDARVRLRAGLTWQGEQSNVFYGLTWLGKEFEAQNGSQVVGSVHLGLRF